MWDMMKAHLLDPVFVMTMFGSALFGLVLSAFLRTQWPKGSY